MMSFLRALARPRTLVLRAHFLDALEAALESRLRELELSKHGRKLLQLQLQLLSHIHKLRSMPRYLPGARSASRHRLAAAASMSWKWRLGSLRRAGSSTWVSKATRDWL